MTSISTFPQIPTDFVARLEKIASDAEEKEMIKREGLCNCLLKRERQAVILSVMADKLLKEDRVDEARENYLKAVKFSHITQYPQICLNRLKRIKVVDTSNSALY